MTAPGGGEYLPPVITRFLGDVSDLVAKAAEGRAAVEGFTSASDKMGEKVKTNTKGAGKDVDDFTDLIVRDMRKGESAVDVLRRRLKDMDDQVRVLRKRMSVDGANQGLYAEFRKASDELKRLKGLAKDIAPDLINAGHKGGQGFLGGFMEAVSGIGRMLIPILVIAIIMATPLIASAVGAAVVAGLGLGFVGIGALIAAMVNSKVKDQFLAIGQEFKKTFTFAVSGAFDDGLRSALLVFRKIIPTMRGDLRRIFDDLAPHLKPLAEALGKGMVSLVDGIAKAIDQITSNGSFDAIIAAIPPIMEALGKFLATVTENGPALVAFIQDGTAALVGFINGLASVIAWLEKVYLWMDTNFPKIDRFFMDLPGKIGGWFADMWGKIVAGGKAVGAWFASLGKSIWGWMSSAGAAVGAFVMTVVNWFAGLPGKIVSFLTSLPGRVAALISAMAHRGAYLVGWMIGSIVRFFAELPGRVTAIVSGLYGWVRQRTGEFVTWVAMKIHELPGQAAHAFSAMWSAVTGWMSRTYTSAVLWFARTKQSIIMHVAAAVTGVINYFKGMPGRAASAWQTFKDRAVKFFSGAKNWLIEAGKNIVRGLMDGVSGMWNWAVDKMKSFAHDILKGFKDALGMHSPSKAFEDAGENSAMSYANAWGKAIRKARDMLSGPSAMNVVMGYPTAGDAPRGGYSPPPPPSAGMVHTTVNLDGKRFVEATTPASQKRGFRSGTTGIGVPSTRIM